MYYCCSRQGHPFPTLLPKPPNIASLFFVLSLTLLSGLHRNRRNVLFTTSDGKYWSCIGPQLGRKAVLRQYGLLPSLLETDSPDHARIRRNQPDSFVSPNSLSARRRGFREQNMQNKGSWVKSGILEIYVRAGRERTGGAMRKTGVKWSAVRPCPRTAGVTHGTDRSAANTAVRDICVVTEEVTKVATRWQVCASFRLPFFCECLSLRE